MSGTEIVLECGHPGCNETFETGRSLWAPAAIAGREAGWDTESKPELCPEHREPEEAEEHALITEMDATDLIGRIVANPNGAEFVVTGLTFHAGAASVVIQIEEIDLDTGQPDGHEMGVMNLHGWSIHNKLKVES